MPACISDAKTWMTQNKLKLNNDGTQAFLMISNRTILPDAQPTSLRVGTADISFPTCARNLGFIISDNMTLHMHISTVCGSAYVEIRYTSSVHQYLTVETTKNYRLCLCSLQVRLKIFFLFYLAENRSIMGIQAGEKLPQRLYRLSRLQKV